MATMLAALCLASVMAVGPVGTSVLVLPLEPRGGVTKDQADLITALLIARVRALPNYKVIAFQDVVSAMTQEQRKMLSGCDQASCAAEIAAAMSADQIILGAVFKPGRNFTVDIQRILQRNAQAVGASTRTFEDTGDGAFLEQLPFIVADLFPEFAAQAPRPAVSSPQQQQAPIIIQQGGAPEQSGKMKTVLMLLRTVGGLGAGLSVPLFLLGGAVGVVGAAVVGLYVVEFYWLHDTRTAFALVPWLVPSMGLLVLGVLVGMAAAALAGVNLGLLGLAAFLAE